MRHRLDDRNGLVFTAAIAPGRWDRAEFRTTGIRGTGVAAHHLLRPSSGARDPRTPSGGRRRAINGFQSQHPLDDIS